MTEIQFENKKGIIVIYCPEEMGAEYGLQFKDKLDLLIEAGNYRYVINFSQTRFINSLLIGMIFNHYKRCVDNGGTLKMCNVPERIYKIFYLSGFFKKINIYNLEDEALDSFINETPQKKIMVVDDDDSIIDLLKLVLGDRGYELEFARFGWEAYEKNDSFLPDLIIMDVLLPDISGDALFTILNFGLSKSRELVNDVAPPTIVMTAYPDDNETRFLVENNPTKIKGVLKKPFDSNELIEMVESVFAKEK